MKKIAETYAIIKTKDLPSIDFSQIGETSANTIVKSVDETQFVIKYNSIPTFIADETVEPVEILSHRGCLELMLTPFWFGESEEI